MREPSGEGESCWLFGTFAHLPDFFSNLAFRSSRPDSPSWIPKSSGRGTGGAMRQFALLWSFLVCAPTLGAQSLSTISGIVVDSARAVLPRATVRLLDKTGNEIGKNLTD